MFWGPCFLVVSVRNSVSHIHNVKSVLVFSVILFNKLNPKCINHARFLSVIAVVPAVTVSTCMPKDFSDISSKLRSVTMLDPFVIHYNMELHT